MIPLPLRCLLLPAFLHTYIGCDSLGSIDSKFASSLLSSSNSLLEHKSSPLVRLRTSGTILSSELDSVSVPDYGQNEDVQVHSNDVLSEKTSPFTLRNISLNTDASYLSRPDPLSFFYPSLPSVTTQHRVTSTTPSSIITVKGGRVYESTRQERQAEEGYVEDTRSEGGRVLSVTNHTSEGSKNKNSQEKEEVDEKEDKQEESNELFVYDATFSPQAYSVTNPVIAALSGVDGQDIAEGDSMEHNLTINRFALPPLLGYDANITGAKEDAERVNDKDREEKGEDGSDGVNTTYKYDSHASGDSRLTPLGEDNDSVTGSDLKGGGAQSDVGEDDKAAMWTPPRLNVTGIGLYVPMPPEYLHHLLAPLFPTSRHAAPPTSLIDR